MSSELLLPTLPSLLSSRRAPFIHRDLSWLQFNERVLAEARSSSNPTLERLKFLGITSSNLDEFFMIRFAAMSRSIQRLKASEALERRRFLRLRTNLLEAVARFIAKQTETFEILSAELQKSGVTIVQRSKEGDQGFELGRKIFHEQILPRLSPPEPFSFANVTTFENLQLAVLFGQNLVFRIPKNISSAYVHSDPETNETWIFLLDDLLSTHLGESFRLSGLPGMIRLTRDGDIGMDLIEEDPESIPEYIRTRLKSRERGRPLRLQWSGDVSDKALHKLSRILKLSPLEIFPVQSSLCLQGLVSIISQASTHKPALRYPEFQSILPGALQLSKGSNSEVIFNELAQRDILLHHPYDSFDGYVNFIRAACSDPQVQMIEQTVYRVDTLSPVIEALKRAASAKRVRVVIELRARFDELNNLQLTEDLRNAGVEVAFGFGNLKLHAKVALVSRIEPKGMKLYTHLSTGNYNASTARLYTDLAILTSSSEIGADARNFFDSVWAQKVPSHFKQLVSAPLRLHRRLLNLIENETQAAARGEKSRIFAKVNALVDEAVINSLYKASQAGVQVDLVVRGACSLVPGVKGLSENIRVISIVDRYLEHSRIYYFEKSRAMYLSSADWMPRNFFSRLELAFPVLDQRIFSYLESVLIPAYLRDTAKAHELMPEGTWKKRTATSIKSSEQLHPVFEETKSIKTAQEFFQLIAKNRYKGTPLNA
jgi:polyphosphate kinase